ncbi:hypothetical protein EJ357_16560 [Streptomyces cyaneochromogenes]|uniref:Uncharacterized protein n=1 Tax=Streptomyces cyaneochromogenes TaxID=2496836 RepID=A0A3S9M750_9ACTN|nr:hypothetical protein [Streptomyces cyaneochromogenes]AZQ34900.1 hypothetical protein EJ357_16560 [Streptomyces cyaneochromogenes]
MPGVDHNPPIYHPDDTRSVPVCRRMIHLAVTAEQLGDTLELLGAELVSSAVRHPGGRGVALRLSDAPPAW